MNIAGWKDVLRPIRDGFRHLFPSPDTGPTPEERAKQRRLDALKGFQYFDTLQQLEEWTESSGDQIQRANTPLLARPETDDDGQYRSKVLLCHDYAGNYHEYEDVRGSGVDSESYSCEYLQYVETFIYFSHKLVCVPPPSWTNTLHRNGVKLLGTFLIEPGPQDTGGILQSVENSHHGEQYTFPVASKLAAVAKYYGFDGWLINIEKPFSKEQWDLQKVLSFLRQLKQEIGENRYIIWYDALTTANKVEYQNSLTTNNLPFAEICDGILTNYCWKEDNVEESKSLAQHSSISVKDIYFGVDVWAQNATPISHPRASYPEKGGGGTNTGKAVAHLARTGPSVGIFAPAWSFEHFPEQGRIVERAMWEGTLLPDNLDCPCSNTRKRHPSNANTPIRRCAKEFPAGSNSFLYSDFSRGFAQHGEELRHVYDGKDIHSQLGQQSVLPSSYGPTTSDDHIYDPYDILFSQLLDQPSRLVIQMESHSPLPRANPELCSRNLRLFKVNMPADGSLEMRVTFGCLLQFSIGHVDFYLSTENVTSFERVRSNDEGETTQTIRFPIGSIGQSGSRLREIGVHIAAAPLPGKEKTAIMEIMELCISPTSSVQPSCHIGGLRFQKQGEEDTAHWRLCWTHDYSTPSESKPDGVPCSDITGPLAFFLVEIDGLTVGRAYAPEFVLRKGLVDKMEDGREVSVKVTGVSFDGRQLGSKHDILRAADL